MTPSRGRRHKYCFGLITAILSILFTFSGCAKEPSGPERRMENGVEVVTNGDRPYPIEGKLATLTIKEEFRIDLEDPKYAEMGLYDAQKADFDSQGRVIIFRQFLGDGPLVFIFDRQGRSVRSFGRKGQGPGEIADPYPVGVTDHDEIVMSESNVKIAYFDEVGTPVRSIPNSRGVPYIGQRGLVPLASGSFLIQYRSMAEGGRALDYTIGVFNGEFRKIQDLANFHIPDINKFSNPFLGIQIFSHSREAIFVGSTEGGGEISVFDLNGIKKRTIRKHYRPVPIQASFRDRVLKQIPERDQIKNNLRFPDDFPPFHYLFADEDGRLYVSTYEKDPVTEQNFCEIFASDGTYIQRAAIGYFDYFKLLAGGHPGEVVVRNGRVLCVRDKENGFREVIVSSLIWN